MTAQGFIYPSREYLQLLASESSTLDAQPSERLMWGRDKATGHAVSFPFEMQTPEEPMIWGRIT